MRTADVAAAVAVYDAVERAGVASIATHIGRARLLDVAGDPAAGLAALKPATDAGDVSAHIVAARIAGRSDPDLAVRHAEAAAALRPDDPQSPLILAEARLAQGRPQEAAAEVDKVLARSPLDQNALAVRAVAWRMAGDPRLPALYDYAAFVGAYTINTPSGWPDLPAYLAELAEALKRLHSLRTHPVGQSLRRGTQTSGDLRRSDEPSIRAFFTAIDAPIRAHMAKLGRGRDPLRARNTGRHDLAGVWSVRLQPGGRHVDHIHPQGWLSSAFYVELPRRWRRAGARAGLSSASPACRPAARRCLRSTGSSPSPAGWCCFPPTCGTEPSPSAAMRPG